MRLTAFNTPRFMHGGLAVGSNWAPFDVAEFTDRQRAALRDYHGKYIQVHPEDRGKLAAIRLGFDASDKPLVDLDAKKSDASSAGNKNLKPDAGKSDAKKSDASSAGK